MHLSPNTLIIHFIIALGVRVTQMKGAEIVNPAVVRLSPGYAKLSKKSFSKLSTINCWVFHVET